MFFRDICLVRWAALALSCWLVGCASTPAADERDPFESYNRKVFAFNDALDRRILKPVAKVYDKRVPQPVNRSVTNFFSNLGDVPSAINGLLQAKPKRAGVDASRFLINTTVGVLGLFDVASRWDLESGNENFGQTLKRWGAKSGPYMMWPIFGGRTLTDSSSLLVDNAFNPINYANGGLSELQWMAIQSVNIVDQRADILDAESVLSGDRYSLFREAYFQQWELRLNDGVVEDDFAEDTFEDDIFE